MDKSGLTTMVQELLDTWTLCTFTQATSQKKWHGQFWVILVELLTRKKPFSYFFSEGDGLISHFVNLLDAQNLLQILDPQVMEEGGKEVELLLLLAASCQRPTQSLQESGELPSEDSPMLMKKCFFIGFGEVCQQKLINFRRPQTEIDRS
jgi:hypothetical protein